MITLIFFGGLPVSRINGEKYGPYWYEEHGYRVEYWNLTLLNYTQKALDIYFGGHKDYRYQFPNERVFKNRKEVAQALAELPSSVILNYIDFGQRNDYWILRLFEKHNIKYYLGPLRTNQTEDIEKVRNFKIKIIKAFTFGNFRNKVYNYLYKMIAWQIYKHTNFYKKPLFVAVCGSLGKGEWLSRTRISSYLSVPSVDIAWTPLPNLVDASYAVFVDDAVAYSPDKGLFEGNKNSTTNDLQLYLTNMRNVFDVIEKELGLKIVIATSGKYYYSDRKIFGEREIFYGKTNQLIQYADLVLGHGSSGSWQAAVDKKPVIILTDETFISTKLVNVSIMAKLFNVTPQLTAEFDINYVKKVMSSPRVSHEKLIEQYYCEQGVAGDSRELVSQEIQQVMANS